MSRLRPQSRTVTIVYGAVALVILLVIAAVALIVSPPSPPAIAEYAPRATERIDEALKAQSSKFGEGDGGDCASGRDCADVGGGGGGDHPNGSGTHTTRRVVDVQRVRRCVGNPPRQTEDPQSPPCVNYWEGDNGGSTYQGVTRDEIRVAVPESGLPDFEAFLPHFNNRYELYGRKLRLVGYEQFQDAKAQAVDVAELGAFAAVPVYYYGYDSDQGFAADTAKQGIVTASAEGPIDLRADQYRAMAPHAWTFRPPSDVLQRSLGGLVCSSLVGRDARFAGPSYQLTTRKFGIVVARRPGQARLVSSLQEVLNRCGVTARVYEIEGGQNDLTALEVMRSDGVTSILAVASTLVVSNEMGAANKIGYQPEWIVSGLEAMDGEHQWAAAPPEQRAHLFGIGPFNKILPPSDEPAFWALREGDPDSGTYLDISRIAQYEVLLLLASGMQLAGPRLTPQSFAAGLQKARFANPGHGAVPYYQAHVGFTPGVFAMADDVAVVWFGNAAPAYRSTTKAGGWCYVGRGRRFAPTGIPDIESALFNPDPGACR